MVEGDHEFLKRLLATFRTEAQERITSVCSGIVAYENAASAALRVEICERIFREIHSLKGAARTVNMTDVEAICQALEDVFATLKGQETAPSPLFFDVLHQIVDRLGQRLFSTETVPSAGEESRTRELIQLLERTSADVLALSNPEAMEPVAGARSILRSLEGYPPWGAERATLAETVRISTAKLDAILLQAEELLSAKLVARQRVAELQAINAAFAQWRKVRANIDADVRTIQQFFKGNGSNHGNYAIQMTKLLEFLQWETTFFGTLESTLALYSKSAEHDQRSLSRMVDDLLEDMKKVVMLPFASLLEPLPKVVRDLAHAQGKQVELVIEGAELEIDRRLLEQLKDPLLHLIRNGVDHGIEQPEVRARKGKPPRGTVTVAIAQRGGSRVEVLISDDGSGIDAAAVRAAASRLGLMSREAAEACHEQELVSLIFESGVSTSPSITDISGRGLGLAIVGEKVEEVGGIIAVETSPDMGTAFRLVLPLTIATFRGLLVRVYDQLFVVPVTHVDRVVRLSTEDITAVANWETMPLHGQAVALIRLGDVLDLPREPTASGAVDKLYAIVLGPTERRLAFLVDEVLDEQEVLMKHLGKQLPRVRNIAGATLLGNGQVVPILNVLDLMKSAVRMTTTALNRGGLDDQSTDGRRSSHCAGIPDRHPHR